MRYILVSHSHWDRAWYLAFETFRFRLVRLIDRLLDLLESDPGFVAFTLDGQTVLLEDYLEIRPDQKPRLEALIRAGRLHVGPFYMLPDAFLAGGEPHIRNLQRGLRDTEAWGHTLPPVGYMPDPFGHIAQMPQILKGFGIDTYLLTRGLSPEDKAKAGAVFSWRAPNGDEVLAYYGRDGYFNAASLGHPEDFGRFDGQGLDVDLALAQIEATTQRLAPLQESRTMLLLNGFDHMPEQPGLPALLQAMRDRKPDLDLTHGSLAGFFEALREETPDPAVLEGDLIGNADHPILLSVYSTRMYLKQQHHAACSLLERIAEPMALVSHVLTPGPDARPALAYAWRELLRNLPHDDICGCSIDPVHEDGEARNRHVMEVGNSVVVEALETLRKAGLPQPETPLSTQVLVFNPHPWAVTQDVETTVWIPTPGGEFAEALPPHPLDMFDADGAPVPCTILHTDASGMRNAYLESTWGRRYRIRITPTVPAVGYAILNVIARESTPWRPATFPLTPCIDHPHWKVIAEVGKGVTLTDKRSGQVFEDVLSLVAEQDAGDTYSFGPVLGDVPNVARLVSVQRDGSDTCEIRLGYELEHAGTTQRFCVGLRVEGEAGLAVCIRWHHALPDTRLRAVVRTGIHTSTSLADATFWHAPRTRPEPITPEQAPERYAAFPGELVYATQHQHDFVAVRGDAYGVMVANRGLPEYELLPDEGAVAITLCRSVGWLSRKGGRIRRVGAGPHVPTPGAQCLRPMEAHLLIAPFVGAMPVQHALTFSHPLFAREMPYLPHVKTDGNLPGSLSLAGWDASSPVRLSSLKPEDQGPGVVLRVYNPTGEAAHVDVALGVPAQRACRTSLREVWREEEAFAVENSTLPLDVAPYSIVTCIVRA